ncbi:ATP-dependent endonuclease [Phyllobacterium sp. P30BS-XVII]|uniref:ATP-dependent nuclease n=1 Tax=Phyllobacterium sp. P30BS-XVII TaxID=2587046 RepID=UPI0015F7CB9F|nr:ATP-dependent endonuclease [Phyllobacterium sp. P30BS-XVII]MBA8903185.1 putative ATP-dependent endonuclease of OLD family [Phyllobacterium sp. P30BS-XVII]
MHIESIRIRNFRRLQDVRIDLASDISIFVGANNSGKTSATHALQLFTAASRERFSIHDFSSECWDAIDGFGAGIPDAVLPTISMDIWFNVEPANLYRVVDLLPSLSFTGNTVGIRVEFAASNPAALLRDFQAAYALAAANSRAGEDGTITYHPSPRTLCDYLRDESGIRLRKGFELRYYVLDRPRFDDELREQPGYVARLISTDKGRSGKDILAGLVKVDFLHAQRHLSDSSGGTRAEELSRVLGRFYQRNLEQRAADFEAQRALADSETMLNDHLDRVFGPTLNRLAELGYPGLGNPRLLIKTALNPATIMSSQDGTRVHYALGEADQHGVLPTLPDRYNGLGFKNLIYMVVELLDLHARWLDDEESRPPLHLVFIEEPEAHLHVQLQQVFVRKVLDILNIEGADAQYYTSQLVVSTHSSHILYERGFRPIRYFRSSASAAYHTSEVLNLSAFYHGTSVLSRNFLERYLKLTHCDLFFADAAVLVEGNVERLLLPQMIATAAPRLQSAYLSVLEIGGAFGHRFKSLVDFLGITTLIITDIDSVLPGAVPEHEIDDQPADDGLEAKHPAPDAPLEAVGAEDEEEPEDEDEEPGAGTACMVSVEGAVTSNQTLIKWLPGKKPIADILAAEESECIQVRVANSALVRVAYQTAVDVAWKEETAVLAGRTLEEAFALENLVWSQDKDRKNLKLRVQGAGKLDLAAISRRLHKKIAGSSFHKTDFALALLEHNPSDWLVPRYIADGLRWLECEVTPSDPGVDEGDAGVEHGLFEDLLG